MKKIICLIVIAAQFAGCSTYKNRSVSFRPPQDYANSMNVHGVLVGAEHYADTAKADETFGFDIRGAGLLPVQVVMDNQGGQGIEILTNQTFLVDENNRYWKILSTRESVDRVEKASASGAIGSGAGKGAMYGAAAGTILGLALGIVSGRNAGISAVKGGVIGGAGGAVIGGASKADDRSQEIKIAADIREKALEGKIIPSGSLASGFIFFPGEATSAKSLRLQVRFTSSGAQQVLMLPLSGK
jgi:hypothetical protein